MSSNEKMLINDVLTAVLVENETHTRSEAKAKRPISIKTPEKFHKAARTDTSHEVNILNCQPDSVAVLHSHERFKTGLWWRNILDTKGYGDTYSLRFSHLHDAKAKCWNLAFQTLSRSRSRSHPLTIFEFTRLICLRSGAKSTFQRSRNFAICFDSALTSGPRRRAGLKNEKDSN